MKQIISTAIAVLIVATGMAQKKYFTKTGNVSFQAGTAVEDIDGTNKSAMSIFDASTAQIEFAVLVKGFEFKRALMQEHFNENYMESDSYPKSIFKGKITNIEAVNFQKDGSYPVKVKGILEIHGVKKEVESTGIMKISGETVTATADFNIVMADYKIAIPSVVTDKVSKTANVKVNCVYSVFK